MNQPLPQVDLDAKTVSYLGKSFFMRPLSEDSYTVLVEGEPVGRVVYTFGCGNGVSEHASINEEQMTAIAEAWFAALDAAG
jgi:hypothetical protein